jgi:hypothetical protein
MVNESILSLWKSSLTIHLHTCKNKISGIFRISVITSFSSVSKKTKAMAWPLTLALT